MKKMNLEQYNDWYIDNIFLAEGQIFHTIHSFLV